MKISKLLNVAILSFGVLFAGAVAAEGDASIGEKIYSRALGRGCGACHDVQPNPDLYASANKLSKADFVAVLKNGRNAMPKVMDAIMALPPVKSGNLTEDQAVDALLAYLKAGKK